MSIDTRHFGPMKTTSLKKDAGASTSDAYAFINRFIAEGKHKSALGTAKAYKNTKAVESYKEHDKQQS